MLNQFQSTSSARDPMANFVTVIMNFQFSRRTKNIYRVVSNCTKGLDHEPKDYKEYVQNNTSNWLSVIGVTACNCSS